MHPSEVHQYMCVTRLAALNVRDLPLALKPLGGCRWRSKRSIACCPTDKRTVNVK